MSFATKYMSMVRRVLPSPLAIAVILTLLTAGMAIIFTTSPSDENQLGYVADAWNKGFWELLSFTMQMMVMLVLGHTIALSKIVRRLIDWITSYCTTQRRAAVLVTVFSILMGYVNWGLGLIFGAILARKVAEFAQAKGIPVNYPLLGACGYVSVLVWHGGLSGSAPLTIAKEGHSMEAQMGVMPLTDTIFTTGNMWAFILVLIALPALAWILSGKGAELLKPFEKSPTTPIQHKDMKGAEKLEHFNWVGTGFGILILLVALRQLILTPVKLNYLNLDSINLVLFGLALCSHKSLFGFVRAAEEAIKGTTGILIQFPIYAGIMGIMKFTGLLAIFANFFIQLSTPESFPFFAYLSSSIVNLLVPSGGGQWQVQGPMLVEAALQLGVPLKKVVMALAYGDQLTNMLQPFWALPLLGITGLKAKDILPYSAIFMLVAGTIYLSILYIF
jgi:short-chain fatty acids transporter